MIIAPALLTISRRHVHARERDAVILHAGVLCRILTEIVRIPHLSPPRYERVTDRQRFHEARNICVRQSSYPVLKEVHSASLIPL